MTKKTFWKLINEHKILIPKIQRDYAQGRSDDKSTQIRQNFLDKIFECLKNDTNLKLDFIYGSVDNNDNFIPLDGQQRLTTLFLLHYYLALQSGESGIAAFKNFTYETRASSKEFIEKLVKNMDKNLCGTNPTKGTKDKPSNYISDNIKNQPWFFNEYLQDPTIRGMLTMLDDIEKHCNKVEILNEIFEDLCDENKCKINFEFLDLEDFKLSDELYIKMNARGKPLSDFENFKAKFIEKIKNFSDRGEIEKSLDNEWLDMFWDFGKNYKGEEVEKTDNKFLAFFHAVLVNLCRETLNEKDEKVEIKNLENISAVYFLYNLNASKVEKIKIMLDNLSKLCKEHKENALLKHFKIIINEADGEDNNGEKSRGKISAYDREKFYVDMLILSSKSFRMDDFENSNFSKFQRVGYNIASNRLINLTDDFVDVLKCINTLSMGLDNEKFADFYDFIALDGGLNANEFYKGLKANEEIKVIIDGEICKAKLILKQKEWQVAIVGAEEHWYLNGQIGFLLDFCCDSAEFDINKCDLKKFKVYYKAFNEIFPENPKDKESIECSKKQGITFRQALLTKGVYFEIGQKQYHFLYDFNVGLRNKIYTWRRCVLNAKNDKRLFLKALLDDIIKGQNVQSVIDEYIQSHKFIISNNINDNQWAYYLIKCEGLWENNYIRTPNINQQSPNNLYLTTKITPNNAIEYYTYALCLELEIESKYEKSDVNDSGKIGIKFDDNKLLIWKNSEKCGGHFYVINQNQENSENDERCICCDSDEIEANQAGMTIKNFYKGMTFEKFNKAKFWLKKELTKTKSQY